MAAAINLVPDPVLIVTQGALFLANMIVVKKLILDPYLKIRKKREALTTGTLAQVEHLKAETDEAQKTIDQTLQTTRASAMKVRDSLRDKALEERRGIIEKQTKELQSKHQQAIAVVKQELEGQTAQIPGAAEKLAEDLARRSITVH